MYDGISYTFTFIGLRYDIFLVILSFNFEYYSSPSFTIFFMVSGSRIKIYFILDLSFEVGKKSQAKFDSNTRWIKVWSFSPHFLHSIFLSYHFTFVQLLTSLLYHIFFFIISYSLLFIHFLFFIFWFYAILGSWES